MSDGVVDWKALRRCLLSPASAEDGTLCTLMAGAAEALLARSNHGDLDAWQRASNRLAALAASCQGDLTALLSYDSIRLAVGAPLEREAVHAALMTLSPWRKGPFEIAGVGVDSEWRSNLKWARLARALDLSGRSLLDVGSGNGYYCYRALGAGARCAMGIDPSAHYALQFQATRHFAPDAAAWVLPLRLEDLPPALECFDVTLSMGVLYHRPSPFEHLRDLRHTLRPGGALVLETLVIEGGPREVLVPEGRYAGMRNVFFLPSSGALRSWLKRAGFGEVQLVDVSTTTPDEQRATAWSQGLSLSDFLDPDDPARTIEGEPAPRRALLLARRP